MIEFNRIVCPTDFSPTSSHAVDYAATLAHSFDAELVLLHIIPEMTYPLRSFGMAHSFQHIQEELHTRANESLKKRADQIHAKLPKIRIRFALRDGEAHEETLACAKEEQADMIVMGTHGHTGITHALLGSTAEKVVRLSECPVLTVRTPE
ncbi:MAG TPA: universal stress protein [bacterium]|nr:universal stress protein [bacterium]